MGKSAAKPAPARRSSLARMASCNVTQPISAISARFSAARGA